MAMKGGGLDAVTLECCHLVVHECYQRGDDQRRSGLTTTQDERWDLVADRLSGAGREQHDRIASRKDRGNRVRLPRPKIGVAKDLCQDFTSLEQHGPPVLVADSSAP